MSSKGSSTSSYLSVPTLFEHPMDVQQMSSKWSSTSSYLTDTTYVWTPHGRPNDVLKGIAYQFLFDWHNTCWNTPWASKWCPQRDPPQVPIWVSQPYLNTPWTCKRCPQRDRLDLAPLETPWTSKRSWSTSSYLTDTTPVGTPHGRPNDVLKEILHKFLFECPNPIWTPHGRAKDVLKGIVYQFLFGWHNTCLNTPWTSKRCPQSDRLPVPIWLTQHLFEHPMDVQMMSSKGSFTSSYLTDTTPVGTPHGRPNDVLKEILHKFLFECPNPIWTPHGRAKDVLKMIVYQFLFDWHNTCLNTPWTCKRCLQNDRLPVPMWLTQSQFEHPKDMQKISSKGSSTSSYLTDTTPVWTPHGRPNDVLKGIIYQFLFECPNPIWTPHGRATDVLKVIVYQFLFDWHNICLNTPWTSKWCPQRDPLQVPIWVSQPYLNTPWTCKRCPQSDRLPVPIWLSQNPVWTPKGHAKDILKGIVYQFLFECPNPIWTPQRATDVLKVIVYQFLFDWHKTCLDTPWTSKICHQNDRLPVPIWLNQPCLNTTMTCKRCPQRDRLPVPIWLTQHLFEHPMDVKMMSSKGSSSSSYLSVPTIFEHPMDVQKMSSKWSSTSSYLTNKNPVWTPKGHAKDILKGIVYQFLFECPNPIWTPHGRATDALKVIVYQFLFDWHKTCLDTPWTSKICPQNDRLPVPIWLNQPCLNTTMTCKRCPQRDRLPVPIWLTQHLFEHPMDVKMMSSKGSSSSSYLTDTTPVWTPHGRPNDVLKGILYKFLFECPNPIWTPHGRATDVLKVIVYQFLFDWHNTCLNTPWTCKRCPQNDRLPVPIWLTQNQVEHPKDMQNISSKGSSTSSYLAETTSVWTPHGRPNDVLKGIVYQFLFECPNPIWTPHGRATDVLKVIVYQFLFDWHNICLNTPWTPKWCPQRDRLPVPIWLTQHLLEHPMGVQMMSSKRSSTSSYLSVPTLFEHPMDVQKMSSKGSSTSSYLADTTPAWTPHERPKDVLKVIVYQFLFDWHNICLNTPWTSKWCSQRDRLPVPIWLTQHLLEHPMDVQIMSSKRSSTSSYLSAPTLFEHPMDVQNMSSKWSSTSSYLTDTTPAWTPHERAKDVFKMIVYLFLCD